MGIGSVRDRGAAPSAFDASRSCELNLNSAEVACVQAAMAGHGVFVPFALAGGTYRAVLGII